MQRHTARGRPRNANAARSANRDGAYAKNLEARHNTHTVSQIARLVFRELRNDDGHFVGIEVVAMIAFSIPGEPVAFARSGGKGTIRFTPKRQRDHMALIKLAAHRAMDGQPPMAGPVRMTVRASYAVPKGWSRKRADAAKWRTSRPDADNLAKLLADAMNEIVFHDDSQVAALHVEKRYGPLPGVVVTVEPLDEAAPHDR